MNRRTALPMITVAMFGFGVALPVASAVAWPQTLKDQMVGTWTLVSWKEVRQDGAKIPPLLGASPQGVLMLDADGHLSFQVMAALPKFASNDRKKSSPVEDQIMAKGVFSYFGTYTVRESDRQFIVHVDRATFPNMNGTQSKKVITDITATELRYTNPGTLAGRHVEFVWRRAGNARLSSSTAPMR